MESKEIVRVILTHTQVAPNDHILTIPIPCIRAFVRALCTLAPQVVWLGKERVNRLGGPYAFMSIGSLKAAMAPHAEIISAGFSHVRSV